MNENRFPFYQSVYSKYAGPTNTRGSRIYVKMNTGNEVIRKNMSYDYAAHNAHDSAIEKFSQEFLQEWKCVGKGDYENGYVYLFQWVGK